MKNKSVIINAVLAIGLIVLYILHFTSSPKSAVVEEEEIIEDTLQVVEEADSSLLDTVPSKELNFPIAYVNMDRLNEEYNYILDGRKRIQSREASYKRQLASIQEESYKLQEEYQQIMVQFQSGKLTEDAAKALIADLEKRQEKNMRKAQNTEESIAKESQNFLIQAQDNIRSFLEKNRDEFKYSYVFTYGMGSNLLFANDSLDITNDLLEALNKDYAETKKKK